MFLKDMSLLIIKNNMHDIFVLVVNFLGAN
jgi:hypothetical protein